MSVDVLIRPAVPSDAPVFEALDLEVARSVVPLAESDPLAVTFVDFQVRAYRIGLASAGGSIRTVVHRGEAVGRVITRLDPDGLLIVDLVIGSRSRRRGVGGRVLEALADEAASAGLPCRLRCLRTNPAVSLYASQGFHVARASETHFEMYRPCPESHTATARATP